MSSNKDYLYSFLIILIIICIIGYTISIRFNENFETNCEECISINPDDLDDKCCQSLCKIDKICNINHCQQPPYVRDDIYIYGCNNSVYNSKCYSESYKGTETKTKTRRDIKSEEGKKEIECYLEDKVNKKYTFKWDPNPKPNKDNNESDNCPKECSKTEESASCLYASYGVPSAWFTSDITKINEKI